MQLKHSQQLAATRVSIRAGLPAQLLSAAISLCLASSLVGQAAAEDADVETLKQEIQELKRQQKDQQRQFEQKLQRLEGLVAKNHATAETQLKPEPAAFRTETFVNEDPDPPKKSAKKPSGVKLTFGGYIEAAGIYRDKDEATDIGTAFQRIPFGFFPQAHVDELRFSARQSRVQGLAEGDIDPSQHLAAFIALDFLGAAGTANSNESNSYNPRLRELSDRC